MADGSFVNVFKAHMRRGRTHGDVSEVMDKRIGRRAYRIRGLVSAANFIEIPNTQAEDVRERAPLRLTGRYVYVEFRPLSQKNVVFHLDTLTADKQRLRISFGTLYPSVRFLGSSLRVPLVLGTEGKWTVFAIDMNAALSLCSSPQPSLRAEDAPSDAPQHLLLLGVTMCSDMVVRGVYTSPAAYTPQTLPGEMALPLLPGSTWGEQFDWVWCPEGPLVDTGVSGATLRERGPRARMGDGQRPAGRTLERRHFQAWAVDGTGETDPGAPSRDEPPATPAPPASPSRACKPTSIFMPDGDWNGKAKKAPQRDASKSLIPAAPTTIGINDENAGSAGNTAQQIRESSRGPDAPSPGPRPAHLSLERIIGFSSGRYPNLSWAHGNRIVFPTNNAMVVMEVKASETEGGAAVMSNHVLGHSARQPFSPQHSAPITMVTVSHRRALLVSAQSGKDALVCLWDLKNEQWLCDIQAHASHMSAVAFSLDDTLLCTVGVDQSHRVQLKIWDVAKLCSARRHGPVGSAMDSVAVIAKQLSDFQVGCIKFSPYQKHALVSCGRENVRFWRIKRQHLPGCPSSLNEYARNAEFTDLAFEASYGGVDEAEAPKIVFVASKAGTLLQVNYKTRSLIGVLRLHNGPINCVCVTAGYVATGSDDCFLRLWPLDFNDFLMEAEHESAVTSISVSDDALKLLVGTESRTMGILDVCTHSYTTTMRSHFGSIIAVAHDSGRNDEFATVSKDRTIRVWDIETGNQKYEFASPDDGPQCLCFHPKDHHLACGFQSGSIRVFNVPRIETVHEQQQHRGAVLQVLYSPTGDRLYSAAGDGHICVYDTARKYQLIKMMASEAPVRSISLALNDDGSLLAALGPKPACVVVFDATTMAPIKKLRGEKRKEAQDQAAAPPFDHIFFRGSELLAASENRLMRFRVSTGSTSKPDGSRLMPFKSPKQLALTPDGAAMIGCTSATTEGDGGAMLHRWRVPTPWRSDGGTHFGFTTPGHFCDITAMAFASSSNRFISADSSGTIFVWSYESSPTLSSPGFSVDVEEPSPSHLNGAGFDSANMPPTTLDEPSGSDEFLRLLATDVRIGAGLEYEEAVALISDASLPDLSEYERRELYAAFQDELAVMES